MPDFSDRYLSGVEIRNLNTLQPLNMGDAMAIGATIRLSLSGADGAPAGPIVEVQVAIDRSSDIPLATVETSLLEAALGVLARTAAETLPSLQAQLAKSRAPILDDC